MFKADVSVKGFAKIIDHGETDGNASPLHVAFVNRFGVTPWKQEHKR